MSGNSVEEALAFGIRTLPLGGMTELDILDNTIRDAVRDKKIDRPMRIFAPGFGAGSVAGFVVMRVDPAVVNIEAQPPVRADGGGNGETALSGRVAVITG